MNNYRIHRDLYFKWKVNTAGEAKSLEGEDLELYLMDPNDIPLKRDIEVVGNVIKFKFLATEQKAVGTYRLVLTKNKWKLGMTVLDRPKLFRLVGSSQEEKVDDWTLDGETEILDEANMVVGVTGVGIDKIVQTVTSTASGGQNEVTVYLTNGTTYKYYFKNGEKGATGEMNAQQLAKLAEVDNKVDKVQGKGLSTNDYSNSEKARVTTLESKVAALVAKAEVVLSASPSVIEKGVSTNVTITAKLNSETGITPDSIGIDLNGQNIDNIQSSKQLSVTESLNLLANANIEALVETNGMLLKKSITLYVKNAIYAGFAESPFSVMSAANKRISTSAAGTYAATAAANGVKYYILVPSGVTLPSTFTMNATPFVMENSGTTTQGGVTYTILVSGSTFNAGGEVNIKAS